MSIRSWIALVATIVALNIAIACVVFAFDTELVIGGALPCIALQAAVFFLLRSQGQPRAFWLGFTVIGAIITTSFMWAMLFPEVLGYNRAGTLVKTPGSALYTVWMGYGRFAGDRIGPLLFDFNDATEPFGGGQIAFRGILWSVPQLLISLVGAFIACCLFGIGRANKGTRGKIA
jgi:hypothetical protein